MVADLEVGDAQYLKKCSRLNFAVVIIEFSVPVLYTVYSLTVTNTNSPKTNLGLKTFFCRCCCTLMSEL